MDGSWARIPTFVFLLIGAVGAGVGLAVVGFAVGAFVVGLAVVGTGVGLAVVGFAVVGTGVGEAVGFVVGTGVGAAVGGAGTNIVHGDILVSQDLF